MLNKAPLPDRAVRIEKEAVNKQIRIGKIKEGEITAALRRINNKAPGIYNRTGEMLKADIETSVSG